jgi:hypothetical protein
MARAFRARWNLVRDGETGTRTFEEFLAQRVNRATMRRWRPRRLTTVLLRGRIRLVSLQLAYLQRCHVTWTERRRLA